LKQLLINKYQVYIKPLEPFLAAIRSGFLLCRYGVHKLSVNKARVSFFTATQTQQILSRPSQKSLLLVQTTAYQLLSRRIWSDSIDFL